MHSPVTRDLRLFKSDVMESMSKSPWWLIPLVWIPTIIYICHLALSAQPSWLTLLASAPPLSLFKLAFILPVGVLFWTLIEYCLHRFVFHLDPPPTSSLWITFHFLLHGQHHKVKMRSWLINNIANLFYTIVFYKIVFILMHCAFTMITLLYMDSSTH